MIRAVLDATTIVAAFPAPAGTLAALIDRWQAGLFSLVVSEHLLAEVGRAWTKPYWQARLDPAQIARALALLRQEAAIVPITSDVMGVATHPEDDAVLATAVSAGADYLVTSDKQLQRLGSYGGVSILSPRDFVILLDRRRNEDEAPSSSPN